MRCRAQVAAQLAEAEQARQELVEERIRMASLLQEMDELRLHASVESNRRVYADERTVRAEEECWVMVERIS